MRRNSGARAQHFRGRRKARLAGEHARLTARELQAVSRAVPEVLFRLAVDGRIAWANDLAGIICDLAPAELSGRPFSALFPPAERERVQGMLHTACSEGAAEIEAPLLTGSGPRVHQFRAVHVTAGKAPPFLVLSGRDVSEHVASLAALSASRNLLRTVIETIPMRVFWKDLDSRYLGCNQAFARDAGLAGPEDIVGRLDYELSWRDQAALYRADDWLVMRLGIPKLAYDEPQTTPSGETIWLRTSKAPLRNAEGKVIGLLGVYEDITEQRQAREAQQELALFLRQTQRIAHLGGWKANLERNEVKWTEEVFHLVGLPPERPPVSLDEGLRYYAPECLPAVRAALERAWREGTPFAMEVEMIAADGRRFWAELRCIGRVEQEGGNWLLGTFQDISERIEAQREMLRANEAADAANRVKSEFIANVSHEIRTPLNAILGLAQLGLRKSRGRQIAATFEQILHSGRLLLGLINDVLDFSKIEAERLTVERIEFDPGETIDRAVDLTAVQAYAKGLDFRVDEDVRLPARLIGDPLRLSQVLVNLLANAVKFTDHGRIALRVRRDGAALLFEVSDTGIGIDQAVQKRLFQPFVQADSSTTRRFGGTGLGLVISRRLVELLGGDIAVHSVPGQGTTMSVRLPLTAGTEAGREDVQGRSLALGGLDPDEAWRVRMGLSALAAEVVILPPEEAFAGGSDELRLVDAALAAAEPCAALALLQRGHRLALLYTPGQEPVVADEIVARSLRLDRPLRWRQLLAACRLDPASARAADDSAPRLAGLRVLAIEDDAANRLVLQEFLLQEGARPTLVEHGLAACARLLDEGPSAYDLVITDMQMPHMDGFETARRLRVLAPNLPVLCLTAHASLEERARCRAVGVEEVVTKPVDIATLVAAIRRLLPAKRHTNGAAAPAPVPATAAGIDWPGLRARFSDRSDFIAQLLHTVLEQHRQTPARLRAAIGAGDTATLLALSHKLAGIGGNLMAMTLASLARRTEEAVRSASPELAGWASQLADELQRVLDELAAHGEGR